MAINKVVYGNNTLIDLTEDTVSADKLLAGETAHDRSGASIEGTVVTAEVVDNLTTQDATKALSANQGYVLNQNKVDKVSGKGLSTNDYTNEEKTKLAGISAGAEPNVQSDWKQSNSSSDDFIKNKPTSDVKTSDDGQFTTVTGGLMLSCVVDVEPIQDLHGYSKPWTGGSGKNKLPNNATTQTINGITWTVETDADGNVIGVDANGTATAESNYYFYGSQTLQPLGQIADGMILSGCPSGGGSNSYYIVAGSLSSRYATDSGYSDTLSNVLQDGIRVICRIINGYTANHVKFRPMIRKATDSADFEPYSNICPISGHTQAQVENVGKNWLSPTLATTTLNGITCTNNGDGTYTVSGTATADVDFTIQSFTFPSYITGKNVKMVGCPSGGSGNTYRLQLRGTNFLDTGSGIISSYNLTNTNNLQIRISSGTVCNNLVFKPMLTLDTSATYDDFEPYNGYSVTINLGGTYYGGTLDAVSGVLTVTHGFAEFDGDNTVNRNYVGSSVTQFLLPQIPSDAKIGSTLSVTNELEYSENTGIPYIFQIVRAGTSTPRILFTLPNSIATTIEEASAWLASNPLQIAYELATPTTIQLDPQTLKTLVGQNNVFAPLDGQTVEEVEFREVLAFEDVPKAIPYECVDPIEVEEFTVFKIHKYGRVVVLKFYDLEYSPVASEDGWVTLGKLPEKFYHKYPNPTVAQNMIFGVINDDNGTLQMKQLTIEQYGGNVRMYFLANEQIRPLGSITYILDHD